MTQDNIIKKAQNIVDLYSYNIIPDEEDPGLYRAICQELSDCWGSDEGPIEALRDCMKMVGNYIVSELKKGNEQYLPLPRIKNNRTKKSFDKTLFCGSGLYSLHLKNLLLDRVNYAIDSLSGEQQNGGMGTQYDHESAKDHDRICREVIEDVVTSLGYKDKFQWKI